MRFINLTLQFVPTNNCVVRPTQIVRILFQQDGVKNRKYPHPGSHAIAVVCAGRLSIHEETATRTK